MNKVQLVFPHQLFERSPWLEASAPIYLVEEFLFFSQYPFHKQKIAYHRATMRFYESFLKSLGREVYYVEANEEISDIRKLIPKLKREGVTHINYVDTTDFWLEKRIQNQCEAENIVTQQFESPLFLNTRQELQVFFRKDKKKYHQTTFYKEAREKRNILLDSEGKPEGGKWTYDTENRKKYPAKKVPPPVHFPESDNFYKEAVTYVEKNFSDNLGTVSEQPLYPTNFESAEAWFQQFLEYRFMEFGPYEDALVAENSILNHSVLTPAMNVGLITPERILEATLFYAEENDVPINSTEGFVRQIIGWREFIRGIYEARGSYQRTQNFWGFTRKIPASFYDGSTGIPPIDKTIKKVLQTGYCHHIERLMVLGNFMMLCEFDPDEVYRWFMELFIDAYDWVMVPNVYGMSQFSDGGLMATKAYISGSNYLMKMSNYKIGDWQRTWDGLFWRFMDVHREFFLKNPRLGMLIRTFERMSDEKKQAHHKNAEAFLSQLDS